MATFPHSFRKVLIGKDAGGSIADIVVSGTTADLTANQIGLFDAKTYQALPVGSTFTTNREVILAQGSSHTVHTLALGHGGYKDSIKTRPIEGKYITSFRKVSPVTAVQQIVAIGYDGVDAGKDIIVECGKIYTLRLTIKGSPADRFIQHNLYHDFIVAAPACDACAENPCDTSVSAADKEAMVDDLVLQINSHPYIKDFVLAEKLDGTTVFGIKLTGAYVDTTFGNCSFEPMDHVELDLVTIEPTIVVNDPMKATIDDIEFEAWEVTELQAKVYPSGLGENVLRELITFLGYKKEDYFCDPRMRTTQNLDPVLEAVDRTAKYKIYYLTYNVPYYSNKTNLYNNEEYEIMVAFKSDLDTTVFENLINQYIESNGILLTGV
jgi:hypothetical protein